MRVVERGAPGASLAQRASGTRVLQQRPGRGGGRRERLGRGPGLAREPPLVLGDSPRRRVAQDDRRGAREEQERHEASDDHVADLALERAARHGRSLAGNGDSGPNRRRERGTPEHERENGARREEDAERHVHAREKDEKARGRRLRARREDAEDVGAVVDGRGGPTPTLLRVARGRGRGGRTRRGGRRTAGPPRRAPPPPRRPEARASARPRPRPGRPRRRGGRPRGRRRERGPRHAAPRRTRPPIARDARGPLRRRRPSPRERRKRASRRRPPGR